MKNYLCYILGLALLLGSTSCLKDRNKSKTVTVSTFAGSGVAGASNGVGTLASFHGPEGVTVDIFGNVYVADANNNQIRKITHDGTVTTVAGSGERAFADGPPSVASFASPIGLVPDAMGNVYVGDCFNNRIRKVSRDGNVTTVAGSGEFGSVDGPGESASFKWPHGVAMDLTGNIYVASTVDSKIRKINPQGVVTTLAGNGAYGYADGVGSAASFNQPQGVAVDVSGNVYVADSYNFRVRKINPQGVVTTLAGSGIAGASNGTGTAASFRSITGIAIDHSGNLIIADIGNNMIRKVSPQGVVTTLAGTGAQGAANGPGASATFNAPNGVAVDLEGNIYVSDYINNLIRKIEIK